MKETTKLSLITAFLVISFCSVNPSIIKAQIVKLKYISTTLWSVEHDIIVIDTIAYCAYNKQLVVLNVTKPEKPVFISRMMTRDYTYGLDIVGNYAYIANKSRGLLIIDINEPTAAVLIGRFQMPGWAMDVFVSKDYAYITDGAGLVIVNITEPSKPMLAGICKTPGSSRHVYVHDNYAYVADKYDGLQIIDISNPSNPSITGNFKTQDAAWSVYVDNGYAYVANNDLGLQIVDVRDPYNPTAVANYETPGQALGVYISDGLAYIADGDSGIQIIDISFPQSPKWEESYFTRGTARSIYVYNSYAYINNCHSMIILDLNLTDINNSEMLPDKFSLFQNYPNPFNMTTVIKYELPYRSMVKIDIFDALGRKVTSLIDKQQPAGYYKVQWNAEEFTSGVYFCKIQAGEYSDIKKMVLLK